MNILLANFAKMVNDSGGLAKVTCAFAKEMYQRGYKVTLVYSDDKEGDFFFEVPKDVRCYNLRHYKGRHNIYPLRYKIKREILRAIDQRKGRAVNNEFTKKYLLKNVKEILDEVKPDIIVASQPAASKVLLSDLHVTIPVITMSHGDPEDYFHTYPVEELPSLGLSAACQVLVPSYECAIKSRYPEANVVVIGNVVPQHTVAVDLSKIKDRYNIVFIGRMVKNHKRPHLLLEAFSRLADEFSEWNLEFWGAEDDKKYTKELLSKINHNHLQNRVFIKGVTDDVVSVLKNSDILGFPSAYEGFSLALTEAMSVGLPVVGYRNCSGLSELVDDGKNGFLVDDGIDDFVKKLRLLMVNRDLRTCMGEAAHEAMNQYSAKIIWDKWDMLLHEML